jgi:hypothetical protein
MPKEWHNLQVKTTINTVFQAVKIGLIIAAKRSS